ncbi:MAG TPA: hypothetical protein VG317_04660 [Pseudonocardiaceae bacterium]|nr:hypothetical protein [Pseudonocardiaceae bacterium]
MTVAESRTTVSLIERMSSRFTLDALRASTRHAAVRRAKSATRKAGAAKESVTTSVAKPRGAARTRQ